jgi:hypothetical protein
LIGNNPFTKQFFFFYQQPCQTWWFHCPFLFIVGLSTNMIQCLLSSKL